MSGRRAKPRGPWQRRETLPLLARVSLRIATALRAPLRALGVEHDKFLAILSNRLWLETAHLDKNLGGFGAPAAALALSGVFIALSGLIPGVVALASRDVRLWLSVGLGMWSYLALLLTLGHFATLLVDGADIAVLAGLPVRDRTVLAARIAHIAIYALVLTACATIAPIGLACFVFPAWAVLIVYPLGAVMTTVLVIATVAVLFGVCLRLFGVSRFERATLWLQISGSALPLLVTQLALPWLRKSESAVRLFENELVRALLPPLQFEALYRSITGAAQRFDAWVAAAGFALPVAVLALALGLVRGRYVAALMDRGARDVGRSRGFRPGWLHRFGLRRCSESAARAAFGWTWALTRGERSFVRGVAPQSMLFVTMGVMFVLFPSRESGTFDPSLAPLAIYSLSAAMAMAYIAAEMSENAGASSGLDTLPLEAPTAFLEGVAKALVVGVGAPLILGAALLMSALVGPRGWLEVALACVATFWFAAVLARRMVRDVPFRRMPGAMPRIDQMSWLIGVMLPIGVLMGLHALLRMHWLAMAAGLALFAWRAHSTWRALEWITPDRDSRLARPRDKR